MPNAHAPLTTYTHHPPRAPPRPRAVLLEARADINAENHYGRLTPIAVAAKNGRLQAVKMLSAYLARRSGDEVTLALDYDHPAINVYLRATADRVTPLHFPVETTPRRARKLLRSGTSVHARSVPGGSTPHGLAKQLVACGAGPRGSTSWLICVWYRIHRWRMWAMLIGRLVVMQRRAAERAYAPGGLGMQQAAENFKEAGGRQVVESAADDPCDGPCDLSPAAAERRRLERKLEECSLDDE